LLFIVFLGRIIRNIESDRIKTEQTLSFNLKQNDLLKELDVLKTNFFTNISHEFRTPLSLISAPIDDLVAKYPSENLLPMVQRNAQRLLALVNQLLDIGKLEAGQMKLQPVNLDIFQAIRVICEPFVSLAESKSITFDIVKNGETALVSTDKDKLEKILSNLLSNAFKFTKNGGTVRVQFEVAHASNELLVTVSDTGRGIPEKELPKIFDRFYQVESASKKDKDGSGIGLALVKELIGVFNGTINVTSVMGKGTTFNLSIPFEKANVAAENPLEEMEMRQATALADVIAQENVLLVVDDNEDIRQYIASIFNDNFKIVEAENGKEGLVMATQYLPDVIISDLMMPEMNGFTFCEYLKGDEKTSHIPIIMLTAKTDIESKLSGLELGADDYLTKPFNPQEIKARVKNILEKQERLRLFFGNKSEVKESELTVQNKKEDVFLTKAYAVIEKNLSDNNFGVEQFCQELNMSSSQLLRKLKALTNKTTVEFVRDYRLGRAASMLNQGETVSEVALSVGFESLSYFTKMFQDKFGVLPSEYKAKNA
jgi:DNA-binding response OmpR family regulator/anti-sigma regulatory factor (Ser/Thr protein kinase)